MQIGVGCIMDDTSAILGKNIKDLRKRFCVTQSKLAEYLGCTENAIYRWETGLSYPSSYYLPLIADRFHVSIDYLFDRG